MLRVIDDFTTYPRSVQKGLVLLLVSWIWFFSSMHFFVGIEISNRELVAGAGVLVLAGTMKNWARWLCIMCSVMACLYSSVVALVTNSPAALIFSAVLFALSAYYLFIKTSSEFYKAYNYIEEDQGK
jgi:hypothetical protein